MRTLLVFCVGIACQLSASFAAELAPAPAKVVRYADVIIKRYDTNGDGVLQTEEWKKMPGTPQAIDLDGDGLITKDKLVWYFNHYGQSRTIHRTILRDLSDPYKFDPANLRIFHPIVPRVAPVVPDNATPPEPEEESREAMMKANEQPIDDDAYLKMLEERRIPSSRPYHVLPDALRGVPAWFILLDKNGDGQISLLEFAPTLDRRAVELFKQRDKNGDGVIEPDEARSP
ncbi:MAG: hypothetical protein LBI05_04090 [Planctomycetaceae bacterium]|nr:hypothetical protein [Planctomycetaceae bacterium]